MRVQGKKKGMRLHFLPEMDLEFFWAGKVAASLCSTTVNLVKPVGSPNKGPTVKSLVNMSNGQSSKLSTKASESYK
jgi:hypothetical protein